PCLSVLTSHSHHSAPHSFPTRRSSDLLPQCTEMDAQLRQRFATRELEIANRVIAFRRCGIIARADKWDRSKKKCRGKGVSHHCRDRKSTRLNSSHVAISYAVFCLKKKT